MRKFIILLLSLAVFYSCDKYPDKITLIVSDVCMLDIKIVDNDDNPIEGSAISVIDPSDGYVINKTISDKSGLGRFQLLKGNYFYMVRVDKNKVPYQAYDNFQIISGEKKIIEVNAFENSGVLDLLLFIIYSPPKSELNVALVPKILYGDPTADEIDASAHFKGKTDNNNFIRFRGVPTDIDYMVYVYDENKSVYYTYNSYINSEKGIIKKYNIEITEW